VYRSDIAQILQVFYSLNRPPLAVPEEWTKLTWVMLIAPYAAWLACLVASIAVGRSHSELVSRNQHYFFCAVNSEPLGIFMAALTSIILAATIALLLRLIMVMFRQSKAVGLYRSSGDVSRLLRIIAFGFHSTIGIVLEAFSAEMGTSPVPHLIMATMGTGIIMIFATQSDVVRALYPWKHTEHGQDMEIQPRIEVPLWDVIPSLRRYNIGAYTGRGAVEDTES